MFYLIYEVRYPSSAEYLGPKSIFLSQLSIGIGTLPLLGPYTLLIIIQDRKNSIQYKSKHRVERWRFPT